jgi:hypothetical protein
MALGGVVFLAGRFFEHVRQPSWLSILPAFYPGLAVSVPRGLTEPLCMVWIIWALLVWESRPVLAGVMLSLAVLTRETSLLLAAAFGIIWLWGLSKKRQQFRLAPIWALPASVYLLWRVLLHCWILDDTVASAVLKHLGMPFVGLIEAIEGILGTPTPDKLFFLLFILMLLGWQIFVGSVARPSFTPLFLGWILFGILVSVSGVDIWDNSPGLLRIAREWSVLGLFL